MLSSPESALGVRAPSSRPECVERVRARSVWSACVLGVLYRACPLHVNVQQLRARILPEIPLRGISTGVLDFCSFCCCAASREKDLKQITTVVRLPGAHRSPWGGGGICTFLAINDKDFWKIRKFANPENSGIPDFCKRAVFRPTCVDFTPRRLMAPGDRTTTHFRRTNTSVGDIRNFDYLSEVLALGTRETKTKPNLHETCGKQCWDHGHGGHIEGSTTAKTPDAYG